MPIDHAKSPDASAQNDKRPRWENIAILVATLGLFFAATQLDLHTYLHSRFEAEQVQQPVAKMRAMDNGSASPAVHSGLDIDELLTFGLFASLGLSAFGFLQSRRLRRALRIQQEAEQESIRLALHDQLTGLANRRNFEIFGTSFLREKARFEHRALLLIDLDHFKPVNDVYGHAAGDTVLVEYARRIESQMPGGIVARFGGDEFAIITPPLAEDGEALVYARACIGGISEPFFHEGAALHLGASVGVAMLGDGADTVGEALRRADIALYKAKHAGRHQIAFFEDALEKVVMERNWLENELHKALKQGDIIPYFQPIVDLATREVIAYEALARWQHSERGIINPLDFIPIAEECGLIVPLGEQILAKASEIARRWPAHIKLSVNLSPVQLREKTLGMKLIHILETSGFPPSRLEVEITENALIADLETARGTIDQLRAAGISIALDDFGTGHSSLHHLRTCKFDKIKIDQTFVRSMQENHESRLIVDAILNLSKSFGIRCTAEGIENASDVAMLADWGCTEGQGYLFGRPAQETGFEAEHAKSTPRLRVA